MRIARIVGRVTASVKAEGLSGQKMLLADIIDRSGNVLESSVVMVDACGAGPGDEVLVAAGSAARVPAAASGVPTDAAAVAFIDEITASDAAVKPKPKSTGKGDRK